MFLKLGCIQTAVGERMVNGEAKGAGLIFFLCTMLCIVVGRLQEDFLFTKLNCMAEVVKISIHTI